MTKPTNEDRPSERSAHEERELQALSAFIDDELHGEERDAVAARIASDSASGATAAYHAQDNALRALFADQTEPQIVVMKPRAKERVLLAACFLVVRIGCGFLMHMFLPTLAEPQARFAERADIAYAMYAPEQRHAVEVGASQQDHLVTWLSKRLNRSVTIPSLTEYGFQLVGGRLLPGEEGPAAQFMYQNAAGERLTLYMTTATVRRNDAKVRARHITGRGIASGMRCPDRLDSRNCRPSHTTRARSWAAIQRVGNNVIATSKKAAAHCGFFAFYGRSNDAAAAPYDAVRGHVPTRCAPNSGGRIPVAVPAHLYGVVIRVMILRRRHVHQSHT
ncbi:Transmembrane regulator protein PrtR [Candidatus Burkholderia humilis]|nr:Transmembrane regulator protein PrtR [Candidatus Burkholderia humilis]